MAPIWARMPPPLRRPTTKASSAAPLEKVLEIYAEFVGRNLLRPATLPDAKIVLNQITPLTKLEVVQAIEAALYLNNVSVVNVGEKFVTVVTTAEVGKIPGQLNTSASTNLADLGSILTHIAQLKYTKPSELVQVLTPFASGGVIASPTYFPLGNHIGLAGERGSEAIMPP